MVRVSVTPLWESGDIGGMTPLHLTSTDRVLSTIHSPYYCC